MYELSVFPTQIFNSRTSSPQEYLIFYSELILANIVILSSIMLIVNSIVNSCAFFYELQAREIGQPLSTFTSLN